MDVDFPIGIAASPLSANAHWVDYFARNGFNVVTYKTVRTRSWPEYSPPHWIILPEERHPWSLSIDKSESVAGMTNQWPGPTAHVSTANSFGVPSADPDLWQLNIRTAALKMARGQLLIASVMGSREESETDDALIEDFVEAATRAEKAFEGVQPACIELNLSFPTMLDQKTGHVATDLLCHNVPLCSRLVDAVRQALTQGDSRLLVKLAALDTGPLRELISTLGARVDGVSGINAVGRPLMNRFGEELFEGRDIAGFAGVAVRNFALSFVQIAHQMRDEHSFNYSILASGGVVDAASFLELYRAGADVVQTVSGAFINPFLARDLVSQLGDDDLTLIRDPAESIVEYLRTAKESAVYQISDRLELSLRRVLEAVRELRDKEQVEVGSSGLVRLR